MFKKKSKILTKKLSTNIKNNKNNTLISNSILLLHEKTVIFQSTSVGCQKFGYNRS
jgi:hypothetical protein